MTAEPPRSYLHAPRLPDGEIDPRTLFGSVPRNEVELEIGPGRGGFLFERLALEPEIAMIGLEIRRKWAALVDERLQARGFGTRAKVFAEDARVVLPRFQPGSLRAVFIHFPDPWWKKRHEKRLLLSDGFAAALGRALVSGGELFVQTDVLERLVAYESVLTKTADFAPWAESARIPDNPYGAQSPRERRAVADGLPVYRLRFRRV
jgi:tRNA (guanine-N7-)-methyltransferase